MKQLWYDKLHTQSNVTRLEKKVKKESPDEYCHQ